MKIIKNALFMYSRINSHTLERDKMHVARICGNIYFVD